MEENKYKYLELQYKEALNQARCYIDSRYKILQFIGFYNGAVLTFGFSKDVQVLSVTSGSIGGIIVTSLSLFVVVMGLSTEFALISYIKNYFYIINKIEALLNNNTLEEIGTFTYGARQVEKQLTHKLFPVDRTHRYFYFALVLFWLFFLIFQIVKL